MSSYEEPTSRPSKKFWKGIMLFGIGGLLFQLILGLYFVSVAHQPTPKHLPIGIAGAPAIIQSIGSELKKTDTFEITKYGSANGLKQATKERKIYGGYVANTSRSEIVTASAAGSAASSTIKTAFTGIEEAKSQAKLQSILTKGNNGILVSANDVQMAVNVKPLMTDVAEFQPKDITGGSATFLIQVLTTGASVAAAGLGRLLPSVKKSWKRGMLHVGLVFGYAFLSGLLMTGVAALFGVGTWVETWQMVGSLMLISLAIVGSLSGLVALIGPAGTIIGALVYLLLGAPLTGAAILPEGLPAFWHVFGEILPTSAGTYLMRNVMYLPEASYAYPFTTLGLFAGVGMLIVLVTNALPNRSGKTNEADL